MAPALTSLERAVLDALAWELRDTAPNRPSRRAFAARKPIDSPSSVPARLSAWA
ncbi:hypothetical protein D3C71_789570 [compost metagenome]